MKNVNATFSSTSSAFPTKCCLQMHVRMVASHSFAEFLSSQGLAWRMPQAHKSPVLSHPSISHKCRSFPWWDLGLELGWRQHSAPNSSGEGVREQESSCEVGGLSCLWVGAQPGICRSTELQNWLCKTLCRAADKISRKNLMSLLKCVFRH